jgi:photosystem II stability/assembly factor-like uncharacterized protein
MGLVIGTNDDLYRTPTLDGSDAEQTLDCGRALRVRRFDGVDGVFAATHDGLYRSLDGGTTWTDMDVPRTEVYSVVASPNGERLYAGTHPAHLYVSTDVGETWNELDGFQELPSRDQWHTPRHRNEAHIRSLGTHPDVPHRLIAGVEVGGVHVSEDDGETWTERRDGAHDDIHHVLVQGPSTYVASTGTGLYRTEDAGESWTRLDTSLDHRYFREAIDHEGTLFAAAARGPPGTWRGSDGADAILVESTDAGATLETVPYPGAPDEIILAWTVAEDTVIAGTNDGRILQRTENGWETQGTLPAGIRSLVTV